MFLCWLCMYCCQTLHVLFRLPPSCPPVCSLVVQVIEEDATQATALAAVLDQEVLVAPLLELGVVVGVVAVANLQQSATHMSARCVRLATSSWLQDQIPLQHVAAWFGHAAVVEVAVCVPSSSS